MIVLAVRWYLRFGLSFRDVEELLAEAARPCRHAVGNRWHVDETYVMVAGRWSYVYRAIDQFGQVIDIFVSAQHDGRAARRFFERAIGTTKITPVEMSPTMRRCTRRCSRTCCRRSGIAPIGMPTTTSSVTTAG